MSDRAHIRLAVEYGTGRATAMEATGIIDFPADVAVLRYQYEGLGSRASSVSRFQSTTVEHFLQGRWVGVEVPGLSIPFVATCFGVAPLLAKPSVVHDVERSDSLATFTVGVPPGIGGARPLIAVAFRRPLTSTVISGYQAFVTVDSRSRLRRVEIVRRRRELIHEVTRHVIELHEFGTTATLDSVHLGVPVPETDGDTVDDVADQVLSAIADVGGVMALSHLRAKLPEQGEAWLADGQRERLITMADGQVRLTRAGRRRLRPTASMTLAVPVPPGPRRRWPGIPGRGVHRRVT